MSNEDPFDDEFEGPTEIVSAFPKVRDLNGHLILFTPTKLERGVASNFKNNDGSPQLQDRVTTDVVVLDGSLDDFDDTEFEGMWISNEKIVQQMSRATKAGKQVLARVGLNKPKMVPGAGNPFVLFPPSDDDRKVARKYLESLKDEDPFAV